MYLALLATLANFAPAAPSNRSEAIELRRQSGELDAQTAAIYQVWAFRDPSKLPPDIAALPEPLTDCATEHFVRAFQMKAKGEMPEPGVYKGPGRPISAGYYDSSTYPIRSHYTTAALASRAQSILEYAENSWRHQVGVVGFNAPLGDYSGADQGGSAALDFYVGNASGAGGYTAPEYDWASTAITDCTSWVMISEEIPDGGNLASTVAHEFNHVVQGAHDCMEFLTFWENSATYMMEVTYDHVDDYLWFIPDFQQYPYLPFEYHDGRGSAYQYGGVLVAMILDEAYGNADGVSLRRVWELSEQTNFNNNEPDYFDGIETVVRDHGGDGIDDYQRVLTEWRYLTGSRHDGGHLSEAGWWDSYCQSYCEPPDDAVYDLAELPVTGTAREGPYGHGSAFVRVNTGRQNSGKLRVDFGGNDTTRWDVSMICVGSGAAQVTPIEIGPTGAGAAQVVFANADYCTMAVSNLYLTNYDPDDDFSRLAGEGQRSFTYGFTYSTCDCDYSAACDGNCACDPECINCVCDLTFSCDPDCPCDAECQEEEEGCACAGTTTGALAIGLLPLLFVRRRKP